MTPSARQKIRSLLIHQEELRLFPYDDATGKAPVTEGNITLGVGRNVTQRGITMDEALQLLDNDINFFSSKLTQLLPLFQNLDESRQVALISMAFNLGIKGFMEFDDFLTFMKNKDYEHASSDLLATKAALRAPERYQELARIIRTGEL